MVLLPTLWMLTFSEIIGHAEWVTMHELISCTMAKICRSSYSGADHFQLRGLLCPDLREKKRERKRSYTFSELWKSQFSQTLFYPHETSWWFPVSHRWILCSHQVWISLSALREATALLQLTPLPAPAAGNYSFHFSSKAEPKRTALKTDKNPMARELRKKKYMTIGSTEGRYVETWATTAVPFLSMTGIQKNIKL